MWRELCERNAKGPVKYNTERVEGKLKNVKMLDYMASGVLGISPPQPVGCHL